MRKTEREHWRTLIATCLAVAVHALQQLERDPDERHKIAKRVGEAFVQRSMELGP